ncbi:MAG: efflux transporter periplasmic adaptor subunit [Bacteroidetes bacterium]|nr:MAG: efflux transporter periplasmic adaptor subunit [Bacteroidota bacterium]
MPLNPITSIKMKAIHLALLALTSLSVLNSCKPKQAGGTTEPSQETIAARRVRPVRTMSVDYRETAILQNITSTVAAYEETYLSPALSGKIRAINVEVNDRVIKGQLLAEMDRTQLDQTRLQYESLKTDLARMDTLLLHGSVTRQAYDQMKSKVETTELVLRNLEENTLLRAPYDGVITGKYYNEGELYSPAPNTPAGKAALLTIMQLDPVKLLVSLGEKNLPLIRKGMEATVTTDVYPEESFTGRVFRIHPTVSAATRTFIAELKVPNSAHKLAPGMFARVGIKLGEKKALIVPAIAVLQQAGTNQRYIMLNENGRARKVVVDIVNRYDNQLEIASPEIKGGEEMIYTGHANLENGEPVNVVSE